MWMATLLDEMYLMSTITVYLNSTAAFVSAILNKLIKHMQTRGLVLEVSCVGGEVKHETLDLPA